ncbi:IclR family transcriptional regulator domain-containing protein [Neoaquamicrobium sediminum]|uniref:IclR family transcriptional regulator domain-containing protein n=1 Tax=Neoaquamicrobium sediminum TaxID=1849104 RepID=UPI00361EAF28
MPVQPKASVRKPYKEIQAVTRALEVIEAIADLGWVKVGVLASYTDIDRGSLYRLIHTLETTGYLSRRAEDGAISLGNRFGQIADGIRQEDIAAKVLSPLMRELTERVMWPSDFGAFIAGQMVIQASSHIYSPVSVHRKLVGKTRPLLRSALGLAYLSALEKGARQRTLEIACRTGNLDKADIANPANVERAIDEVHHRGYAVSIGLVEQNIGAVAIPVQVGRKAIGAVNIVYFRSAMSTAEAVDTCLPPLREMTARASALLASHLHVPSRSVAIETTK